jgi:predicted nucleic acid-binding protein
MIRIENLSDSTQDSLTKALLESSLLLVHNRNKLVGIQRHEVFLKTVFAIIASEGKPCTTGKIAEIFAKKFHKEIKIPDIEAAVLHLEASKWVKKEGEGYKPDPQIAQIMKDDLADIEQQKQCLVDGLITRLQKELNCTLSNDVLAQVSENIKLTLNLYVRLHGMDFFSNEEEDIILKDAEASDEEIINQAKSGLTDEVGTTLIEIMSDMIARPTPDQRTTLSLLIKTLIGAQIMQVDPQLSQLQVEKLKDKTFVLDTDFLLNCIVKYPKESNEYKKLLSKLRRIGCTLIVPDEVVSEVVKHVQNAEGNYVYFKNTYNATDNKDIEEYATNVFVKDYYLSKEKYKYNIHRYLENHYYDRDAPRPLIEDIIKKELHLPLELKDNLQVSDELEQKRAELEKKITESTRLSPKSKHRDEEEIASISETDAKLFLYVLSQNQHLGEIRNGDILTGTTYLITYTAKSIRCAREMGLDCHFVTRPEILINILYEIGLLDDAKDEYFNLFDNPFLAHIINENWETIKKASNLGIDLHNKGLSKLDRELGEEMNKYILQKAEYDKIPDTDRTSEVRLKIANDYRYFLKEVQRKHYKLMPEVQAMADSIDHTEQELAEERRLKEEAQRKYAQKEYRQKHYEEKLDHGRRGQRRREAKFGGRKLRK